MASKQKCPCCQWEEDLQRGNYFWVKKGIQVYRSVSFLCRHFSALNAFSSFPCILSDENGILNSNRNTLWNSVSFMCSFSLVMFRFAAWEIRELGNVNVKRHARQETSCRRIVEQKESIMQSGWLNCPTFSLSPSASGNFKWQKKRWWDILVIKSKLRSSVVIELCC